MALVKSVIPFWFEQWFQRYGLRGVLRSKGISIAAIRIVAWRAYRKGKRDWVEKVYQQGLEDGRRKYYGKSSKVV